MDDTQLTPGARAEARCELQRLRRRNLGIDAPGLGVSPTLIGLLLSDWIRDAHDLANYPPGTVHGVAPDPKHLKALERYREAIVSPLALRDYALSLHDAFDLPIGAFEAAMSDKPNLKNPGKPGERDTRAINLILAAKLSSDGNSLRTSMSSQRKRDWP